jgi:hypothetical protein
MKTIFANVKAGMGWGCYFWVKGAEDLKGISLV